MTYLISEKTVKSLTNVSDDIQGGYLQSAIRESQVVDLQQVLGSALLDKMCELVETGDIAKEEYKNYKRVLDEYITYFLAYRVIARLCMISSIKISNAGLNQPSLENVQTMSMKDVYSVQDYYTHKSDWYKMELQNVLLNHYPFFPELDEHQCRKIHSNLYSAATTGLFLGGTRGKGFNFRIDYDFWK